eukprot:TRINITY_DN18575_c0_g1_i1.p1 TRINITY_DN18575_c0_g1~~TRINITY_DN18575_c0_g1_i1.p1  ORF type:complete len:259 (-),score=33.58 TRINITY_DN18575_c0_g1_i1:254-1030(-)
MDPSSAFHNGSSQGPSGGGLFFQKDTNISVGPVRHTDYPTVTGTSVLGIKYKDGVLMAADTLASYGSTKRFKAVERLKAVNSNTLLGASGEMSDFHAILTMLEDLTTVDSAWDDGNTLGPQEITSYLNRVMYNRRNKFDPLWNSLVIAGVRDAEIQLGVVTMIGVHYSDSFVATGFGNHLAIPIFRTEHRDDMTEEEGIKLLEKCMRVLYYRDKQSSNKIQIAKVTAAGIDVSEPYALKTEWGYTHFQNPTKNAVGSW